MTTIQAGENFLLDLVLTNPDGSPILVTDLISFTIYAKRAGTLLKTWTWLPDDAGDPHLVITDGLAELEVESSVTINWLRRIEFEVVPSYVDTNYPVAGAQTDVVCFNDLLTVEKCV